MKNAKLAWDMLSQKERSDLIKQWESKDAYPYGQSNSKRLTHKITSHYLRKRVEGYNDAKFKEMKVEFKKVMKDLKNQVLEKLMEKDLTDEMIWVRDEISNFTGGCIDHEIEGLCTKLYITSHNHGTITLEDDLNNFGEFELERFSLEFLLTLL